MSVVVWSFYDAKGYFVDAKFRDGSGGDPEIVALNTPAGTTAMRIDADRLRQRVNVETLEVEDWASDEIESRSKDQLEQRAVSRVERAERASLRAMRELLLQLAEHSALPNSAALTMLRKIDADARESMVGSGMRKP